MEGPKDKKCDSSSGYEQKDFSSVSNERLCSFRMDYGFYYFLNFHFQFHLEINKIKLII